MTITFNDLEEILNKFSITKNIFQVYQIKKVFVESLCFAVLSPMEFITLEFSIYKRP